MMMKGIRRIPLNKDGEEETGVEKGRKDSVRWR